MGFAKEGSRLYSFLVISALIAGFVGFTIMVGTMPMKLNPAYRQAILIVRNDPAVAELIGPRVWTGIFVWGTIEKYGGGSGFGNMQVSLYGSEHKGELYLSITKARKGDWLIQSMSIEVAREEILDWMPGTGFVYADQPGTAPAGSNLTAPTMVPLATPLP